MHLDGYDQSEFLRNVSGTAANNNGMKSARDKFFYSDDDGLLVAMRKGDYKYVYAEQRLAGTMGVWAEPFTKLRLQKIYNLFQDPFERADITSNTFWDWQINHVGQVYGAMDEVFEFVATFKEFPPRSFPPSFVPATILEEHARRDQGQQGEGGATVEMEGIVWMTLSLPPRRMIEPLPNCFSIWPTAASMAFTRSRSLRSLRSSTGGITLLVSAPIRFRGFDSHDLSLSRIGMTGQVKASRGDGAWA